MATRQGTLVGTGYVDIRPDFSRFQERVGRQLNQALAPVLKKAGGNAGKELARGLGKGDFGRSILRRFERVGDDAGKAIAAKVGKGAKRAEGDMFGLGEAVREVERRSRKAGVASRALDHDMFGISRAAKTSGRSLLSARTQLSDWHVGASKAEAGAKRLLGRVRGLGYEFGSLSRGIRTSAGGFSGFDGVMARVNRSSQFFRNIMRTLRWPALISGVGLAMQGLSALAAGAVAALSALGTLSGALVALPAAALAGAQAFSVLKLATAGVGDAVKAALDVEVSGGQQAVDVMRQQEDAAERVADAKRNLTDVQKQARVAQDDLREARESATRQLQDMRLAAEASGTSEKQAVLSLREARRELAKTLSDPETNGLDVQGAELAVEQARNDLESTRVEARRAREDYRDAQKAGVDQMPEVIAAEEAKAQAKRAVEDADRDLKRAIEDNTAAMAEQGSAASALQEKMAQLPPAAQKFVRLLVAMKPRLDALRATAAAGFFPGVEKGLNGAVKNFGVLQGIVGGTSKALGGLAVRAGKKLGSDIWGKDLGRLGKLNTRIINRMGDSAFNLADAFRNILVSAEPFLGWLSQSTKGLTGWIKSESEAGRKSGKLTEFFERTRETMERLGPIFEGVGGALLNIGSAARPLGNEILDALGDSAEGWRRWTDSTKGENHLKRYFTETKPAIFEMGKLIGAAGKAFFELGKQRGVAHLLSLVRTELIPAMTEVTGAVTGWASDFLKQFGALREEGVGTFDAFVRTLADHAGQAGWKIAKALGKGFLNTSILGKLTIGAFVISQFGGKGKILAVGAAIGRWLGLGIAAGTASSGAAGGAAAGAGSAAAGGVAGGLLGRLKSIKWGRTGALAIGLALGENILNGVNRRMREGSDDLLVALGAIEEKRGVVRELQEQVLGPFIPDAFGDERGIKNETTAAKNLKAQLQEMLRKRLRLSAATVGSLRDQARELDLTKQQRVQVERMFEIARAGRRLGARIDLGMDPKKIRQITREFSFLRSGIGTDLKDINRVSRRAGRLIVSTFGAGTRETRELTSRNMRLTATAIEQQMKRSGTATKEGWERIRRLFRNADLLSPTRKQAQGFGREWAEGMDRTKEVTTKGVNAMIREAQKMPRPMRKIALETWFEQVRQARKSGDLTTDAFRKLRSRMFSEFGAIKRDSKTFNREFAKSFVDMVNESGGAMGILMENLSSVLKAVSGKGKLDYSIKKAKSASGEQQRQTGGFIVPGSGSGDKFKTLLPAGSFILNREATAAFGFRNGGLTPVALEAKERAFLPHEVKAMGGAGTLEAMNKAVPRQKGGPIGKPLLNGPAGSLRDLGRAAIEKVQAGAKEYLASQQSKFGVGLLTGSGNVEQVFANVARRLSQSKIATLALGMAGYTESGMRDLPGGDSTSSGSLQLLSSTASGLGIDPHDESAVASAFLLRGFYGRGGANALAAKGLPAHLVAQSVQGSAFSDGSNYLAQQIRAQGWMKRFGLRLGGVVRRLAAGGMVDPGWDPGTEMIAGSIEQLVGAFAKRYDIDITAGFDPGGGHESPGHNATGTATDVVPRSGNWDGAFAKGLETLAKLGFEVGYDGSIPGTQSWSGHGRGNHAHIEWVGNGTSADARQRLRNLLGGVAGASGFSAADQRRVDGQRRKGSFEARLQSLRQRVASVKSAPAKASALWQLINYWGRVGVFDKGERGHILESVQKAASKAETENALPILSSLAQFVGKTGEVTGEEPAGARSLVDAISAARGRGQKQRSQIVRKQQRKRQARRNKILAQISGQAEFKDVVARIAGLRREADTGDERAGQLVTLEPENLTDEYVGREGEAYGSVLGTLGDWRNTLLRAQETATQRIQRFQWEIGTIMNWRVPGQPQFMRIFNKLKVRLPALRQAITDATAMRDETWAGELDEVQGLIGPRAIVDKLPSDPTSGFGGRIFDIQNSLRDLGLKARSEGSGDEGDSERASLFEDLLRKERTEGLIAQVQGFALQGWDKLRQGILGNFGFQLGGAVMPPFAGIAHTGAIVPGPRGAERTMVLKSGERVRTPEQEVELAMAIRDAGEAGVGGVSVTINGTITQEAGDTRPAIEVRNSRGDLVREVQSTPGTGRLHPSAFRTGP